MLIHTRLVGVCKFTKHNIHRISNLFSLKNNTVDRIKGKHFLTKHTLSLCLNMEKIFTWDVIWLKIKFSRMVFFLPQTKR